MKLGDTTVESRYVLTDEAEALFVIDRPNPFGPVVRPRCLRCTEELGECQCSGVRS